MEAVIAGQFTNLRGFYRQAAEAGRGVVVFII